MTQRPRVAGRLLPVQVGAVRGRLADVRWVVPATGAVLVAVALAEAAAPLRGAPTTYASTSVSGAVAALGAAAVLVAVSAVALAPPRTRTAGLLLGLLALTWSARDVVGWSDGPVWARSVGLALVPFALPLVAHLAQVPRPLRIVGYGAAAVYSGGRALFRDPFRDLHCWSDCGPNTFLVRPLPDVVRVLDATWSPVAVALGLAAAGACLVRLCTASAVARRGLAPLLGPAGVVAVAFAAAQALLLVDPAENPRSPWFAGAYRVEAVALVASAVGVLVTVVRDAATRRAVARLVEVLVPLGPPPDGPAGARPVPGVLQTVLARSLADPGLRVAYWLPERDAWVDAAGRQADADPGPRQVVTVLARGGSRVAAVVHDRGVAAGADLEREIGAAARLAVDNERLRAGVLAHLADLEAARGRLVATADATRRRLERDLHDGAQQRLLAVSYELRAAAATAPEAARPAVRHASASVQSAFVELRALAHGIFPAVLAESGLAAALRALATRAPLPVELEGDVDGRWPAGAEAAAYFAVADAVDRAAAADATHVAVRVRREPGALVVTTDDDGRPGPAPVAVVDRVGARGGDVDVTGRRVRAVIPCG